ncbi:MAG: metallophosphoesterase [Acidobacteria bacterium]|nr:MAG: metallophosphoesterase [Acidobacteriota bacterium]
MKVAVMSDIHDNLSALDRALARLDADVLLCCGDLCSPFVIDRIGRGFRGPIHVVFGNNDGDTFRISECARRFDHVNLHGEFAELELGGRRCALHHFDAVARALAAAGRYDVVCFGHTHRAEITSTGSTLLVNPGELFGGLTGRSTFALYDTRSSEADLMEV